MAIFIQETNRSFPNVDDGGDYQKVWQRPSNGDYESHAHHSGPGTDYRITFEDDGIGTTVFGKDMVYYIGDNDPACYGSAGLELNECDYNRQPIYRWYRPNKDHKYTPRKALRWPTDFTGENVSPDSGAVKKAYNAEPRNSSPVFFCARTPKDGKTKALHHWYENSKNDTWLVADNDGPYVASQNTDAPGSGYVYIEVIGYVYNSESDAEDYAAQGESPVPLYEYYKSSSSSEKDHFYTINPAAEVNLETGINGVPDCKDPRGEDYEYVGIVGWVFAEDAAIAGNRRVITDMGLIGPIGYGQSVSYAIRDTWYEWQGPDLFGHPSRGGGTPSSQTSVWTHENYEYQFDADAGPLRTYDADGQLVYTTNTFRSYRFNGTPSVNKHPDFRWGHPDYCKIKNRDAYFEWIYGKNGAVKGAVPKYLEFHTAYDSQFVYYVYNTSYPWKGPIFSIQYSISDRNLCPNKQVAGTTYGSGQGGDDPEDRCVCDENLITKSYHSHFYEIREDKWKTTNSSLSLTDFADGTVEQCFKTVDTDSHTILFRYLTGGDGTEDTRFNSGDTLNGWVVAETAYFGNSMKCGYMELIGQGRKFETDEQYTVDAPDGATIEIIAGCGIPDRAGFFGVYEFPKQISYYKVEIDRTALINSKTLDEAELTAVIDDDGRLQSVIIENGGFGYTNPVVKVQEPVLLNEYGAMDMVRETAQQFEFDIPKYRSPTNNVENFDGEDYNVNYKRIMKNSKSGLEKDLTNSMQKRQKKVPYSQGADIQIEGADQDGDQTLIDTLKLEDKALKTTSSERRRQEKMKPAVIEVSKLDENGSIVEILIKSRGRGYDPDPNNPPRVFVVQSEDEVYKMRGPNTKEIQEKFRETVAAVNNKKDSKRSIKEVLKESNGLHKNMKGKKLNVLDDGVVGSFEQMMDGFNATYPTGYIKIGEVDEVEKTELCQGIPKDCIKIKMPNLVGQSLFTVNDVKFITKASKDFQNMMVNQYGDLQSAAKAGDDELIKMSSFYGWNNDQECITIPQPKFYNVTRFQDLPCPYSREDGRAFGWIVYKYCASKSDNGHFKVNLSIRGKTIGPDGEKFMDFLNKLPPPSLTQPRDIVVNTDQKNCWKCTRAIGSSINSSAVGSGVSGEIEGRCYWDPSGGNDVVFVPVGMDENTFDWDHNNFNELQQFKVWLGDNLSGYYMRDADYTTYTVPGTPGDPGSGTEGQPGYVPPTPGTDPVNGENVINQSYYVASVERLDGGMPKHECWDTYVYRQSGNGNPDGVLDVFSSYFPQDAGGGSEAQIQGRDAGETFWESQIYQGYTGLPTCWYAIFSYAWIGSGINPSGRGGGSWGYQGYLGFQSSNNDPEFALEYVNDLSIAIDTQLSNQLGLMMGPYSGGFSIKNWNTGSTIAFGQTAKNMGNPYFDECSGGVFDFRDEVVQPSPPVSLRKVNLDSYDPGDKELMKAQKKSRESIEFEGDVDDFYDPDFDYKDELKGRLSNFSTDKNNLFNGMDDVADNDYTFK